MCPARSFARKLPVLNRIPADELASAVRVVQEYERDPAAFDAAHSGSEEDSSRQNDREKSTGGGYHGFPKQEPLPDFSTISSTRNLVQPLDSQTMVAETAVDLIISVINDTKSKTNTNHNKHAAQPYGNQPAADQTTIPLDVSSDTSQYLPTIHFSWARGSAHRSDQSLEDMAGDDYDDNSLYLDLAHARPINATSTAYSWPGGIIVLSNVMDNSPISAQDIASIRRDVAQDDDEMEDGLA